MIQTKLALISFIQQLRDEENNLYQYLAYVYSGLGKCRVISLWGESGTRYKERLEVWAKSRNWNVSWGYDDCIFKRKK